MIRLLLQVHAAIAGAASVALLAMPRQVLASLGVGDASLQVIALSRGSAALLMLVAVATLPLSQLDAADRPHALRNVGRVYLFTALLLLAQEITIWSSVAGAVAVVVTGVFGLAFFGAASSAFRRRVAGA